MDRGLFLSIAAFGLLISSFTTLAGAQGVGVNYGLLGNNLPPPDKAVSLLKSRNIQSVRLFDPNPAALKALEGSGIQVILGTLNGDLPRLATEQSFATQWVQTNIVPHANSITFRLITVGNEVIPSEFQDNVLQAIQNLDVALAAANLPIPVTTVLFTKVLSSSFPPSQGAFADSVQPIIKPLLRYLADKNRPLLFNIYPYIAYLLDPKNVRLDYALFTAPGVVVQDGPLGYTNLFDATMDGVYSAMEKAGGASIDIVVAETGWATAGAIGASIDNARTYNNNLLAHLKNSPGTPKRPGKKIETYLFALFNENQKAAGAEQNYGLYYPNMTEVYHVDL